MSCTIIRKLAVAAIVAGGLLSTAYAQSADAIKPYLGRWDLTLKSADHEYPSWLELKMDGGKLTARMVARWGHARELPKADFSDGKLTFVSPKEEESSERDMVFEGKLTGDTLSGTVAAPKGETWTWTGKRAPTLERTKAPKWGKPITLFNGKDLSGWHEHWMDTVKPGKAWTVVDGTLVSPANGAELVNDQKFTDFKLHIEFNCGAKANSGVYLRGRYEVQVEDNSLEEPVSHHTGGVYGFIDPSPEPPRTPGVWQSYDITLLGRKITVVLNGKTLIDQKEIPGITGGALDSHEELPGPIYLQGSEDNHVAYRNIVLTPAKD